ncbi:MAG: hypothetical protein HGA75_07235 [Thiobacillus sp.]|nr:hypothetical protein [Thiobacillus sp.]
MVGFGPAPALAGVPDTATAAWLQGRYAALAERLRQNPFQRPLYLESSESGATLRGDIYAVLDHPFATVGAALDEPEEWCDVLILHVNTKYCRAAADPTGTLLKVRIGKKSAQPLDDAQAVEFAYRAAKAGANYMEIRLDAAQGPLSTHDYRLRLQAVPLDPGRTFIHLGYAYGYGLAGRLAMQAYLATLGHGKVGFTVAGHAPDGEPEYIDGMRGVAERNTMRYYLAIDAYLGAGSAPPAERLERRLQAWFDATERYPRQLHEVSRTAYMDMKRDEYRRQQGVR